MILVVIVKPKFLVLAAILSTNHLGFGVVVISGAANSTAPSGQPYFGNVGLVGGGSAI